MGSRPRRSRGSWPRCSTSSASSRGTAYSRSGRVRATTPPCSKHRRRRSRAGGDRRHRSRDGEPRPGALKTTRIKVVTGDGRDGYGAGSPYDRIIVTASHDSIPHAWIEQLHPGASWKCRCGCVVPIRFQLIPTLRREGDRLRSVSLSWAASCRSAPPRRSLALLAALNVTRADGAEVRPPLSLYGQAGRSRRGFGAALVSTAAQSLASAARSGRASILFAGSWWDGPHAPVVADGRDRFYAGWISRDAPGPRMLPGWPIDLGSSCLAGTRPAMS